MLDGKLCNLSSPFWYSMWNSSKGRRSAKEVEVVGSIQATHGKLRFAFMWSGCDVGPENVWSVDMWSSCDLLLQIPRCDLHKCVIRKCEIWDQGRKWEVPSRRAGCASWKVAVTNVRSAALLQFHTLSCPPLASRPGPLNVFVPPPIKFWPKVPPKKRVIATMLNSRQNCLN